MKIKIRDEDIDLNLGNLDVVLGTFRKVPHVTEAAKYLVGEILRRAPTETHEKSIRKICEALEYIDTR